MKRYSTAILMLLICATCAHKAAPIAKDRLSPRLSKAAALNVRQIQLTFTEEIDTVALEPDSVSITSDGETLAVLTIYPSLSPSELIVVTVPMRDIFYEVKGQVLDRAENRGLFMTRVRGSTLPDTIAPWVVGQSKGKGKSEFILSFSEVMDTMRLSFVIVPEKTFNAVWLDLRRVRFMLQDTANPLASDTTYYIYARAAADISGNAAKPYVAPVVAETARPSDSIPAAIMLSGKALIGDIPADSGLAFLHRDRLIGISSITRGEFRFVVRDSLDFDATVISGIRSGKATVSAAAENIIPLKEEPLDVDSLLH